MTPSSRDEGPMSLVVPDPYRSTRGYLRIKDSSGGNTGRETFSTDLEDIDELLASLADDLQVCDNKARAFKGRADSLTDIGGGADLLMDGRNPSSCDPIESPAEWWCAGLRRLFDWMEASFWRDVCCRAGERLSAGGVSFFTWGAGCDCASAATAVGCAFAEMMNPWTDPSRPVYVARGSGGGPKGVLERLDRAREEATALTEGALKLISGLECEATKVACDNPALSEILSGAAAAMRSYLCVSDRECADAREYGRETRENAVVAARAVALVQAWVLHRTTARLEKAASFYADRRSCLNQRLQECERACESQREQLRRQWQCVRSMVSENARRDDADASSLLAMDVLFNRLDSDADFGPEHIALLQRYSRSISPPPKRAEGDARSPPSARSNRDDLSLLSFLLARRREESAAQLREIRHALDRTSSAEERDGLLEARAEVLGRLRAAAEGMRKLAERRKCMTYDPRPSSQCDPWAAHVAQLDEAATRARDAWLCSARHRATMEDYLVEMTRTCLCEIESATVAARQQDVNAVLTCWNDLQHETERRRTDNAKRRSSEACALSDCLASYERKMVHYCETGARYVKTVREFRDIAALLARARDAVCRTEEFYDVYEDLSYLWGLAYNQRSN